MIRLAPDVPWLDFINSYLSPFGQQVSYCTEATIFKPDLKVNGEEIVIVKNPSFLTKFNRLIKDTPKRIQVKLQHWMVTLPSFY